MAFQRNDLISLYGRDIVDADGSVVTLTNIEFLYSVIEQLMDRIEVLESATQPTIDIDNDGKQCGHSVKRWG